MKIYELIGKRGENEPPFFHTFAEGLAAYRNRQWELAELRFGAIATLDPPSRTYIERCRLYKSEPPPEIGTEYLVKKRSKKKD